MSSACQCHIDGAYCFYCEEYTPLEVRLHASKAEIARLWEIIADMQTTWAPKKHCDSCAHLNVEVRQHRAVRISYLAENERLRIALERMDDRKQPMLPRSRRAQIAKEALDYGI